MIYKPDYEIHTVSTAFDGTLCNGMWPGIGTPNHDLINLLIDYKHRGKTLILDTHRQGFQLEQALEWCKNQGLEFDYVNENPPEVIDLYGYNPRKLWADMQIDYHITNHFFKP